MRRVCRIKKASITVEACVVMPIVIFVVFVLLSLILFVHERAWFTLAACETAVTGDTAGEEETAAKLMQLKKDYPLPAREQESSIEYVEKSVKVKVSGKVFPVTVQKEWDYTEEIEVLRNRPVEKIRKIRALRSVFSSQN